MKYVTLEQGTDFRRIAKLMTEAGYKMNHATARNVLMGSLGKLLRFIGVELGLLLSDEQLDSILRDQQVHEALSEILFLAHKESDSTRNQPPCV